MSNNSSAATDLTICILEVLTLSSAHLSVGDTTLTLPKPENIFKNLNLRLKKTPLKTNLGLKKKP